jgi:hypothetical protein
VIVRTYLFPMSKELQGHNRFNKFVDWVYGIVALVTVV